MYQVTIRSSEFNMMVDVDWCPDYGIEGAYFTKTGNKLPESMMTRLCNNADDQAAASEAGDVERYYERYSPY